MIKTEILDKILGKEGGYVNNPNDKGEATNWGITKKTALSHGYNGDMRNLTRAEAIAILESDYWFSPKFDQVAAISPKIANELCDTGVNMGTSTPIKWLQDWLNVFNSDDIKISVDGKIGNQTLTALKVFLNNRKKEGELVLLKALNCSQGNRYLEITKSNNSQKTFVYGWLKERVNL